MKRINVQFNDKEIAQLDKLLAEKGFRAYPDVIRYAIFNCSVPGSSEFLGEKVPPNMAVIDALESSPRVVGPVHQAQQASAITARFSESFVTGARAIYGDSLNFSELSDEDIKYIEDSLPKKTAFVGRDGLLYEDEFPVDDITRAARKKAAEEHSKSLLNPETKMNPAMEAVLKEAPKLPKHHEVENGILQNSQPSEWEGRDEVFDEEPSQDNQFE